MPDSSDPLTFNFYFSGHVPHGSFQFIGNWDFGDGNSTVDSCPTYHFTQPGTYNVCLLFSICIGGGMSCHDDTCITITAGNFAGVDDKIEKLSRFYIYPNPACSKIYLRTNVHNEVEIKISGITGNEVYRRCARSDESIDISSLSSGLYFIEVSDGINSLKQKMIFY